MKKSTIKLIAMLLTVVLMLPNFAGVGALANEAREYTDRQREEQDAIAMMKKQVPANAAFEQIVDSWTDDSGCFSYPDKFGGFYHTSDYKLAVKLVDNDMTLRAQIENAVDDSSILQFECTDISINDLHALKENVPNLLSDQVEILSIGISQKNSCVVVEIRKPSGIMGYSQAITDIPHVTFREREHSSSFHAINYNSGKLMYTKTNSNPEGTLGWYGTYAFSGTQYPCFATAGHVAYAFEHRDTDIFFGYSRVFRKNNYGSVYCKIVCGDGMNDAGEPYGESNGDYAFFAHNMDGYSSYDNNVTTINQSNKLQLFTTAVTITNYCRSLANLPDDQMVMKGYGIGGSYASYGRVYCADISYTNDVNDAVIEHTIEIRTVGNVFCHSGDSGGPVYYYNSANQATLLGLICGGEDTNNPSSTSDYYANITPITTLVDSGFVPYVG